ncbi:hypothetical protein THAOC_16588, partial [Thalassiosira oceanica]
DYVVSPTVPRCCRSCCRRHRAQTADALRAGMPFESREGEHPVWSNRAKANIPFGVARKANITFGVVNRSQTGVFAFKTSPALGVVQAMAQAPDAQG